MGYKSSVSRGVVETLKKIVEAIKAKGINTIHIEKELVRTGILTGTQGKNATHIVKLGLLAHSPDEIGNYCITKKAMSFLNGEAIPKYVIVSKTNRSSGSRTVSQSEEMCTISNFTDGVFWEVPEFEIREGRIITLK